MTNHKLRLLSTFVRIGLAGLLPKKYVTNTYTQTYDHSSWGEITIRRSARIRRMRLSVNHKADIRLSLPLQTPIAEGIRFLESREAWLTRTVGRFKANKGPEYILPPYSTRNHTLLLDPSCETDTITSRVAGSLIKICYPSTCKPENSEIQSEIRKAIERAWKKEALELLPRRTEYLATLWGFSFQKVSVRNTVSKWGSCTINNDICFSIHLMRLPDHLIDYIILHELCHTVHKNHGPSFHALLDRVTEGRHRTLEREMKNYNARW